MLHDIAVFAFVRLGGTIRGTALLSMHQRLLAEKPEEKIQQEWIDQAPYVEVKKASMAGNGLYAKVELRQDFRLKMYGKPLSMQQYDASFPLDKQPGNYVVKHWQDDADTVVIDCAFPSPNDWT